MLPPPAAVGWLLTDFAVLSVTAAVIGRLPFFGAVPAAGLAGVVNARAWYGLTSAVARASIPAAVSGEATPRDLHVLPLKGRLQLLDREPVRGEPVRIDGDLDLALASCYFRG